MPRRTLGHIANLGRHANHNTARTTHQKARGINKKAKGTRSSKENASPLDTTSNRRSTRSKVSVNYVLLPSRKHRPTQTDVVLQEDNLPHMDASTRLNDATVDGTTVPPCRASVISVQYQVVSADTWEHRKPPTILEALQALEVLSGILKPRREGNQKGFKHPKVNGWTLHQLQDIEAFLNIYSSPYSDSYGSWTRSSERVVVAGGGKPTKCATQTLRSKAKKFIATHEIPTNPYSHWGTSVIDDERFQQELCMYLQTKGKYMKAYDVISFTKDTAVQKEWEISTISLTTAYAWLKKLEFQWTRRHNGLYIDGHERDDVVEYRDKVYIPKLLLYDTRTRTWSGEHMEIVGMPSLNPGERPVVVWYHDESTFYAHDRRQSQWVAKDSSPVPYAKGEGVSLMVADFVSADYGFLRSPNGQETARRIFRAGKNRDGWFTNDDILSQAATAMDILTKYFPDEDHILVYDNATTHQKRPENALSATRMTKGPSANFSVDITCRNADGCIVIGPDGKAVKEKGQMSDGFFADKTPQSLYFPDGHPQAGYFKGMAVILEERGYNVQGIRAECTKFKCKLEPGVETGARCCLRRMLYQEPDFVNAKSILEMECGKRGFPILFLPKFHPELNFIEMCWGRAKFHYRLNEPSSKEGDLERNMVNSLEMISQAEMRRYARRSRRFLDAYHRGLNGKQAVWACKKFKGHRILPQSIMDEFDDC